MPLKTINTPFTPLDLAENLTQNFNYLDTKKVDNAYTTDNFNPVSGSIKSKFEELEAKTAPAANQNYGTVKGDGEYTSILNGIIKVLKADKLSNAVTLNFTGGDVTGSISFSGEGSLPNIPLLIGQGKVTDNMLTPMTIISGSESTGSPQQLLNLLAQEIKAIKGTASWNDSTPATLSYLLTNGGVKAQRLEFTQDGTAWGAVDDQHMYTLTVQSSLIPIAVYKSMGNGRYAQTVVDLYKDENNIYISTSEKFSGFISAL